MRRRTVLASIWAGVGVIGGAHILTSGCGPGDVEIGSLTDDSGREVSVRGEVTDVYRHDNSINISDGTGTASAPTQWFPDVGDCVTINGTVSSCSCPENMYYIAPADIEQ